ncbi:hypothetical protein PRIEUP_LOCUS16608, partial [Pristimantis euphronides]
MNNLPNLCQIKDRMHIPLPATDKINDPEKTDRLCISHANEEKDERNPNSTYELSEGSFTASEKHLGSDISFKLSSADYSALPIKVDNQPKSILKRTHHRISESEDSFILFKGRTLLKDQTMNLSELKAKHSDTEEIESGQLENSNSSSYLSEGSISTPFTNVSQPLDHSVDLSRNTMNLSELKAKHSDTEEIESGQLENSNSSSYLSEGSISTPFTNVSQPLDHSVDLSRNVNCKLHKQFNSLDDTDFLIKDGDFAFRIQKLESYLTEPDQLHMQVQRLKSRTVGIQMAIKHLRFNEQCLKDENLRHREHINRLKIERDFFQLRLSKAEEDREDYVQEMKTLTDLCEQLLNQKKCIQYEKHRLSVQNQFLIEEIGYLKREKQRNAQLQAMIDANKDELVKITNAKLFRCTKEKEELQTRLRDALIE